MKILIIIKLYNKLFMKNAAISISCLLQFLFDPPFSLCVTLLNIDFSALEPVTINYYWLAMKMNLEVPKETNYLPNHDRALEVLQIMIKVTKILLSIASIQYHVEMIPSKWN